MAALAISLPELQQWLPWAQTMPTVEDELAVLTTGTAAFDADEEWAYMLYELETGELVGGAALHRRVGPGAVEIGYWVRSDRTKRGYATSAARALTDAVFTHRPDIERLEIHMDQANLASAAVPAKLGFRLEREDDREVLAVGESGRGFVWVLTRPDSL
jgi:RimJ/RimL family protein N-acetyltransferase